VVLYKVSSLGCCASQVHEPLAVGEVCGTVGGVEPGASDVEFLRGVQPIVEFLGGTLVAEGGSGEFPIERNGIVIAHVRHSELHGALERLIEAVERDAGAELGAMDRAQKQVAVSSLDEQGAFLLRGAVDRIARAMGVSRVTLYSYLNALERRA